MREKKLYCEIFNKTMHCSSYFSYSSRPASVSQWRAYSKSVVFQPCTNIKQTLKYVPIDLRFYVRPFCSIATLLVPMRHVTPPPLPSVSRLRILSLSKNSINVLNVSLFPYTRTLALPGPLPPLRIRLVAGLPAQSSAVNL